MIVYQNAVRKDQLMNNYQIREKSYTAALASARVGVSLANSIVKVTPNMKSQFAIVVNTTKKEEVRKYEYQKLDLEYFQKLTRKKETRNLGYMLKKS